MMKLYGQVNVPVELRLNAVANYRDIFNDVELDVILTGPDGHEWRIPAFWAGNRVFAFRFSAPTPGVYTYLTVCTNTDDCGLHDCVGEIHIAAYDGQCELYQHGRMRVSENQRTFEHVDGKPFFWMADTWWMELTKRLDWPHGFKELVQDRALKGFNVIQTVAGELNLPTYSHHPVREEEQRVLIDGWTKVARYMRDLDPM